MQTIKQNRVLSFMIVALVYAIANAVGIIVYQALTFEWWLSLLIADVAATVATFLFSVLFGNASVYDPYWSVQPIVILIAYAIGVRMTLIRILLLVCVGFWGLRLTANWAYTFKNLTHQDWRYTMLKEKTGAFYPLVNFVGIHLVPTLVVYACTLPAAYAFLYDFAANAGSIVFFALALCSAFWQGIADIQMHAFRKSGTGGFIRKGLWKYSRHPNYLGEISMWWNVAFLVICASPSVWYLAAGALANTVLFFAVSIPMADRRQAKKEGFAEYESQTRALLPLKK